MIVSIAQSRTVFATCVAWTPVCMFMFRLLTKELDVDFIGTTCFGLGNCVAPSRLHFHFLRWHTLMLLVRTNLLAYGYVAGLCCGCCAFVVAKTLHLRGPVLLLDVGGQLHTPVGLRSLSEHWCFVFDCLVSVVCVCVRVGVFVLRDCFCCSCLFPN